MTPEDMALTHAAAFTQARPWTAAEFEDLLQNRFTHVVGDPNCFALFQVIAGEAELLTIATHPLYQRQGLAAACMKNWHAVAADLGAARAILDVAADNGAAIALYEGFGYSPCGRRKGYYTRDSASNCDAIVMERPLP